MIGALRGIVFDIEGGIVLLDVSGVIYEIVCSYWCKSKLEIGKESLIIIYTDVKEDSIKFYGFEDKLEKHVFKLLLQVKGVGAKSASDIISQIDKVELLRIIGSNDLVSLSKIKGLGKKTAERILLELRDKVAKYAGDLIDVSTLKDNGKKENKDIIEEEAILALRGLGFLNSIAVNAISSARVSEDGKDIKNTAELVKLALKYV